MTARDLAEQLEVTERTIYRDLDALGMAGIPVYSERGPGGGYSLVDGYQTRLTGLTSAEIRALFLSSTLGPLADLGMAHALEDALLKLSASLSEEARSSIEQTRQRFHIDSSWTTHDGNSTSILSLVQDAIWRDQRIQLVYKQDNDQQKRYLVDPYGLVATSGEWYLVGASIGMYHTFSIARTLFVETTEQLFIRPADFDLTTYWTEYQHQRELCEKQACMPPISHKRHSQRVQRRVTRRPEEKKERSLRMSLPRARTKKTYYVSQKNENGRSTFKKTSVAPMLQTSQIGSSKPVFKKSIIKKSTFSHASFSAYHNVA